MNDDKAKRLRLTTRNEAIEVLKSYLPTLYMCVRDGVEVGLELLQGSPVLHTPRSQASVIHDCMVEFAKARLAGAEGVTWTEDCGFLLLEFEGGVRVRFKKLGDDRKPRNVPTGQQTAIMEQLWLFPDMANDATLLVAGYQLDPSGTAIADILITCQCGSRVEWWFPIPDPGEAMVRAIPEPERIPGPPTVRARKPEKKTGTP